MTDIKKYTLMERIKFMQELPARENTRAFTTKKKRRAFCKERELCEVSLCNILGQSQVPRNSMIAKINAAYEAEEALYPQAEQKAV